MKTVFANIAVVLCLSVLLPSCKMRPEDAERLKVESDAGNLKSMEMLAAYGDTLVSKQDREHYLDVLANDGNFRALSAKYSEEYYKSGKLNEKQWKAMYMRWMEKGAVKGNPDCMYRLGLQYLETEHYDTTKAMKWLIQAADSCQAGASTMIRKRAGKENVLDSPRFVFRQMWKYNARGQSFLNRASNATFHFAAECLRNSFRSLFGPMWWQCLLLMVVMLAVLIAGSIYALGQEGSNALSIAASGVYGWINGFTLFTFAKGRSDIRGILSSADSIGQFSHQPSTFGLISDICVWATWIWIIVMVLCYLRGLVRLFKRGRFSPLTIVTYTLGTVLANVFFYLLAGALSSIGTVIGVIAAVIILGAMLPDSILESDTAPAPRVEDDGLDFSERMNREVNRIVKERRERERKEYEEDNRRREEYYRKEKEKREKEYYDNFRKNNR